MYSQVFYSARIDGVSPEGTLIDFTHEGTTTTPTNIVVLEPLTPQSSYLIKISAITPRGRGEEVTLVTETDNVDSQYGKTLNASTSLLA